MSWSSQHTAEYGNTQFVLSASRTGGKEHCTVFQGEINGMLFPEADGGFWRISSLLATAVTVGSPGTRSRHFTLANQQQAVNPN